MSRKFSRLPIEMTDTLKSFISHGFVAENNVPGCQLLAEDGSEPRKTDESILIEMVDQDLPASDLSEIDAEQNLIKDLLVVGLTDIGLSADLKSVYRNLTISNKSLQGKNLYHLYKYPMLFTLDISGNEITDLRDLGTLKYLVTVDASKNQLVDKISFPGPSNLQNLDLSENEITEIGPLKHHKYLQRLYLNSEFDLTLDNLIYSLDVLSSCKYLKVLSLSFNRITSLEPLRNLPLRQLDVVSNIFNLRVTIYWKLLKELKI